MPEEGYYTSERLRALVENPLPIRNALIENLLYERTVLMTYAGSGAGKSVISLFACLQASAGENVFGFFEPVKPLKIYYVLGERDIYEPAERMQLMRRAVRINYENIIIDEDWVGVNFLDEKYEKALIDRIHRLMPDVMLVVFDPIYCLASGGLSNPEKATAFAQFSSRVKQAFQCSIWHNNHTTKSVGEYVDDSFVEKDDPYMGSELLKAHINVMYYIKQKDNLVKFKSTKDSHKTALSAFSLKFDIETYSLTFDKKDSITAKQKVQLFLSDKLSNGKLFTFEEFTAFLEPVALRYAQKLIGLYLSESRIINTSKEFEKALYKVT